MTTLSYVNPPPYIHCSKINCFLVQIKKAKEKAMTINFDSNKKMTNAMRHNFSNLMGVLLQFQQLHSQCCGELCAQFALTSSLRKIRNEISSIRKDCIKCLENIGLQSTASFLFLDDNEYDSQDRVDVKRIAVILNHLQMRPEVAKRDDVASNLKCRLNSLDALGIPITGDESESVAFPDLPSLLNYVVNFEDIEFGPLIGEGQAGKVYKGKIKTTNQIVAIKILHRRTLSSFDLEMYRREIFSMSVLRHQNLVKFFGYTTEPPFCVLTEYMEFGSLYDFLLEHPNSLTATEKTLIALDIVRGLEFLHGRGVIHRDLKSLNILLDSRKRAKICDFGLIRMKTKDPMTGLVGTSHWMAPEVLMSSPYYDEKIDIYSFGILMWELLTGERPYEKDGLDSAKITIMILEKDKRPPIPPNTPPNLKSLIERCWHVDPKMRPSCHEIISYLSNPSFQFPGCELVLLMQEPGIINRHSYNSSSLLHFAKSGNLSQSIGFEGRVTSKFENPTRSLHRIVEAFNTGHIEHIENSIAQMKFIIKRPKIKFKKIVPQFIEIMSHAPVQYQPKLIQILFEMIEIPNAFQYIDLSIIAELLHSKDNQVVDEVMAQLSINSNPLLFHDVILSALFEFYNNSNFLFRIKALNIILFVAEIRFEDVLPQINFPKDLLKFTCRKIPYKTLKKLLNILKKIFQNAHEISLLTIQSLAQIMPTTPKKLRNILCSSIVELLKFDIIKKSTEIFENISCDFDSYQCLIPLIKKVYYNSPTDEIIAILCHLSWKSEDAFSILIDFVERNESIIQTVLSNLPINNKNEQLLSSLYCHLLDNQVVLRYREFYDAAAVLLESEYFNKLSFLLLSQDSNLSYIQESPICETINKYVIDDIQESDYLNLMFNLCCRSSFLAFSKATPKLFANMRNSKDMEIVNLSFLCLAVIAKFYTIDFDFDLLLKYSAKVVNTQSGYIQNASSFLLSSFIDKTSCIQEIADIFIETFSEPTKPAIGVAEVFVEFLQPESSRRIREDSFCKLKKIAENSYITV